MNKSGYQMISDKGISLDDEASLYLFALYGERPKYPKPAKLISSEHKKPRISSHSKVVCYRCGKLGHISSQCEEDLPCLAEIIKETMDDVNMIIDSVAQPPKYYFDDYGPYAGQSGKNIPDKTWNDTVFCTNCGEAGHVHQNCKRPKLPDLLRGLQRCYQNNFKRNTKPLNEIESVFYHLWIK